MTADTNDPLRSSHPDLARLSAIADSPVSLIRALLRREQASGELGERFEWVPLLESALRAVAGLPDNAEREPLTAAVHAAFGDALARDGRDVEARPYFARACEAFARVPAAEWPHFAELADFYVRALEATQGIAAAARFLGGLDCSGIPESVYVRVARRQLDAGDAPSACRLLLACIRHDHRARGAWAAVADLLETPAGADACFRVLLSDPATVDANQREQLLEIADQLCARTPGNVGLQAGRRMIRRLAGSLDGAIADLTHAKAARPGDLHLTVAVGRMLLRGGRPREALDLLAPVAEAGVDDADLLLLLAEARVRAGDSNEAVAVIGRLLAARPDSIAALRLKAVAMGLLHQYPDALTVLDECLQHDPGQADAWRLKTSILLELDRLDEAAEALAGAIKAGIDERRAAELSLRTAKAHLDHGDIVRADLALNVAMKLAPELVSRQGLLSDVLLGVGRAGEALEAADRALQSYPGEVRLLVVRARSLRALGRQSEALRVVRGIVPQPDSPEFLRLQALLLCDCGDFDGVVAALRPATEALDAADHVLLSIRGWAHQNLEGPQHAVDAERTYRAACRQQPTNLWYRKGLANALRRLPDRLGDATVEYQGVIAEVQQLRAAQKLTPHLQCLAAWCFCQCGDPETAADWYTAALTVRRIGAATQFDYALALLAGGHAEAAIDEYKRTLDDLRDKDVLRRCGLVYVALTDVRAAEDAQGAFAGRRVRGLVAVKKLLREALQRVAADVPPEFSAVTQAIESLVSCDAVSCPHVGGDVLAWDQLHIVGFHRPDPDLPAGVFLPIVASSDRPTSVYVQSGRVPVALSLGELDALAANGLAGLLPTRRHATADTRVLFATAAFLDAGRVDPAAMADDALAGIWVDQPVRAWVSVMSSQRCEAVLRAFLDKLVERATALVVDAPAAGGATAAEALAVARLAVRAASDEQSAYRALLAYGVAGGNVEEAVHSFAARLGAAWLLTPPAAAAAVRQFQQWIDLRRQTAIHAPAAAPPVSPRHYSQNVLVQQVLERARRIAAMADPDEQTREALRAAAEVKAVVPDSEASEQVRLSLNARLESQAMFYLESDDSILLLARDPAFYSPSALLSLTRPAVNSFAFVKAAARFAGTTNPGPVQRGFPSGYRYDTPRS
jgi:predicted Zn-dependent protease